MRLWTRRVWMAVAAVGGFLAVAMGAFAAHGIADERAAELVRTGAAYGFMHTMSTFACATFMNVGGHRARHAPAFFLSGVALFSGSLYAMAFGAPSWLGMITPIGGVLFLIGWAVMFWAAFTIDKAERP